jgi:hypothetical protein
MDPIQAQNQAPVTEGKKSFGPIAGVIIIVILLILGALYMMRGDEATEDAAQNSSDEVSAIESELQAEGGAEVDLSELDSI